VDLRHARGQFVRAEQPGFEDLPRVKTEAVEALSATAMPR